uniref:Uncharacterized protein n=1 Tax=Timema douglasi TaxID=61478 RepID=A0A7R8VNY5_TIMDO|nr:unnamed protein product [Timema douglasi]
MSRFCPSGTARAVINYLYVCCDIDRPLGDQIVGRVSRPGMARRFKYTHHLVYGGWLSTVYLLYLSFFSMSEIVSPEYQYDAVKMSIYYALSPVAFSLALSWVILACVTGHGGWLNSAMCWRGMTILSKISYSVYLTQFLVFFYNVGTTKTSPEFNAVTVYVSLFEFILVLLASTIMTLLFDLPMQEVKNILMDTNVLFMLLQPNMTVSSECSHARMGNLGTHSDNFVPATRIWAKGSLLILLNPLDLCPSCVATHAWAI